MTATLDSIQRISILRHVASGERKMEGDVVARIALDEINELNRLLKEYTQTVGPNHPLRKVTG